MAELPFTVTDYVIMVVSMTSFVAIGLYYRFTGGRQRTTEEYLLADKNMSMFPVAVSQMASVMSAVSLLGTPAEYYTKGIYFVLIYLSFGVIIYIVAYVYLPVFFSLQKISTYEYLGLRFGPKLRIITSIAYSFQQILYNSVVLYAPALSLEAVMGLDKNVSILVMGAVCTFYSSIGGIKAVVISDMLQVILMFASICSVIIFTAVEVGGFAKIWQIAVKGGRVDVSNFSLDPTERHTWWSVLFGGAITYLTIFVGNHNQIQRLLTMKDLKTSQRSLWVLCPIICGFSVVVCMSGLAVYAVYHDCDPVTAGKIASPDRIIPYYLVNVMKSVPGLIGLFISGIFSASLSTLSAGCNSLAALTVTDYMPWFEKRLKVGFLTGPMATKVSSIIYGILFTIGAFLAKYLGELLQATMSIYAVVGGPLLGVFTLGMFTTVAHETGSTVALLSGLVLMSFICFGKPRPKAKSLPFSVEGCSNDTILNYSNATVETTTKYLSNPLDNGDYFYLYRISYLWTALIGMLWVFVVGYLLSMCLPGKLPWESKNRRGSIKYDGLPDPELFTPLLASKVRKRNKLIMEKMSKEIELKPINQSATGLDLGKAD